MPCAQWVDVWANTVGGTRFVFEVPHGAADLVRNSRFKDVKSKVRLAASPGLVARAQEARCTFALLWPTLAHYGPLWPIMAHNGP
jgi:hypothetical protein